MIYTYKNNIYPDYLKTGNAQKYITPIAEQFCKGSGLDIGGFGDWTFNNATPINITIDNDYNAYNLPDSYYDYIFSSHCLEHLEDYVKALKIWIQRLNTGGCLFLYLPHPDMEYWLPQNNLKHKHSFHPEDIAKLLKDLGLKNVLHSERDMLWSFTVVGFKEALCLK